MRHARRRRRAAAAVLAAALPLLGACGIQETDVIEAGGPASFDAFLDRDDDMLLFFRSADGGLRPVIRTTTPTGQFGDEYIEAGSGVREVHNTVGLVPVEKVVAALLNGPRKEDRAAGLGTALPRADGTAEIDALPGNRVRARLPLALSSLDRTALAQLTCTIAHHWDGEGRTVVELTGQDGATSSETCGLAMRVRSGG
ncbi:hypothetical protein [Streptomyces sp. YS415]|uniref:hypothetical protein n=1 Tax=Streptomyces sp. YS415 TaxID=2944806 RepID=UPI00201FBD12|nr:hypothetical protein [Streptomyces sp. YS415]MCL7424830.1 hypothetical protein [Streptomyces sp. YS415]